ncbi:outer membrane protein assembly factor BamB family protein [Limnoglobus roseus]|uniref:outer membrane protein assembly factor BamB family protein n=1 Tax=Limnoglobus roseus TaxID=2598579 RepID=UPI001FE7F6E5|nr:PQQ-binding-like beta-propeller repeat protein [Limnoglobus roseus]
MSTETGLLQKWPEGGPKKLWTVSDLGGGYSTPSVAAGKIFGMGKTGKEERIWALTEEDGSPAWSTPIGTAAKVGYDEGGRSTPTFANDKVYAVSMGGDLVCLNAKDGSPVWTKSYTKDFGGKVQSWGFSESVLVDGDAVIGTPGSAAAALVKLKAATGETIWQTAVKDPGGANGYSSPIKATVDGVPMYVTLLGKTGGVIGVHADSGKLLWKYNRVMNGTANIPTVIVKDNLVFCSTGYGDGGSALLKLTKSGDVFAVDELKYYPSKELQNHHGGMVLVGDYVYLGRGHNNGLPTCVEFKTGNIVWKEDEGAGKGNGSGCLTYADGMLYFRYQNGVMALVKASPKGFELEGRFDIPEKSNKPSWPHPVVANGRLYVRDQDKLHCFDVKATK